MPIMPTTLCSHSGCNANAGTNGVCRLHKPKEKYQPNRKANSSPQITKAEPTKTKRFDNRPSASKRGYDSRWRSARLLFLNDHPLCNHCQANDIIKPADVVDHIIPHRGNSEMFWDQSNWQSLCYPCHDTKTHTIDKKLSGNEVMEQWQSREVG